MRLLKHRYLYIVISVCFMLPVHAKKTSGWNNLFQFENIKNEMNAEVKTTLSDNGKGLNVFIISNASLYIPPLKQNLNYEQMDYQSSIINNPYPILDHNQSFTEFTQKLIKAQLVPPPPINTQILFQESETILHKALQEIIESLKTKSIDMVIFGGNQVYSNDFMRFFKEMVLAFESYKVPYYQTIGPNEVRGPEKLENLIPDNYYMLRTREVNFLILDNSTKPLVPKRLPEEATEESLWLGKMLSRVESSGEDLIIITYNQLDIDTINFINEFPKLKLKVIIKSDQIEYSSSHETRLKSNPILINNQSLTSYPCAYLNISRNTNGFYDFKLVKVNLPQIQSLAKSRL